MKEFYRQETSGILTSLKYLSTVKSEVAGSVKNDGKKIVDKTLIIANAAIGAGLDIWCVENCGEIKRH